MNLKHRWSCIWAILVLFGFMLLVSGCEESKTKQRIDTIINEFNKISSEKITNVSNTYEYQVFLNMSNSFIRIASNDNNTFIDSESELPKNQYSKLRFYTDKFIKIVLPQITNEEINRIHDNLLTGKYQSYDRYSFQEINFGLNIDELNNGEMRYKFIIEVPNKFIKVD